MNEVLDSTDAYICNSSPRRFGKSYAANMLAAYYSKGASSEEMFSDLEIGKTEDFVFFYLILLPYYITSFSISFKIAKASSAEVAFIKLSLHAFLIIFLLSSEIIRI